MPKLRTSDTTYRSDICHIVLNKVILGTAVAQKLDLAVYYDQMNITDSTKTEFYNDKDEDTVINV